MIPFTNLPSNTRVPLFYAEVDASQANTGTQNQRTLLIGQMISGSSGTPNAPAISSGIGDARNLYGPNSMLAQMVTNYRKADGFGELWCLPLEDDANAVKASGSIEITSAATSAGTLALYIGGVLYQIPVLATQTPAQVAASIASIISADPYAYVSTSVSSGTVTLTAAHGGVAGNEIDIRLNYGGSRSGEYMPIGLGVTVTPMSGGSINPVTALQTALSNCGDMPFDFIVCPYTDTQSMNAIKDFLNDQNGRWSWAKQIYGHVFYAVRGTLASCTTFGSGRNYQHETVLGFNDSPTPAWIISAQLVGSISTSLRNDPGRPVHTLPIIGMLAPSVPSRFDLTERNTLLYDGISTFTVGDDGTCYAEGIITTYQSNAYGDPDNSYLKVETLYTLAYVLRAMRSMVTTKYARVKLVANGTRFAGGSAIVTPNIIKGDVIAKYNELEYNGYVQKSDLFAQQVVVEQNASNPNRVDCLWPGTLIGQLDIFALLAQFRLS